MSDMEQYDECAKRALGRKIILAHILVRTVDEFKGMKPADVVELIEGEPYISKVHVEPGLTNTLINKGQNEDIQSQHSSHRRQNKDVNCQKKNENHKRIIGLNTENHENCEGMIRFDIVFYVWTKDGLAQIIINVEAQKDEPTEYDIINRAIFYVSRLISSQKGRDFEKSRYDDIKKVYSIWVCMNMKENILNHIHLTDEKLLGNYNWKGNLDLINIIMIGLSNKPPKQSEEYELHRLLCTFFSNELTYDEKTDIIKSEYDIMVDDDAEEVETMCNLGQGVFERGIEKGIEQGKLVENLKLILNMYKEGFDVQQIAKIADKTVDEVKEIIASN